MATTTALAWLVFTLHGTFRCAFGARRARRTRGRGGGAFSTGDRGGSALLAFHARLARAARTAFAAALAVTATTTTTTAGTTATAATTPTLFLGGAGFARFTEDLADAFVVLAFLACSRGRAFRRGSGVSSSW